MAPHPTRVSQPQRNRTIPAQLAALSERLEAAESQQRQLKNTVAALGSEVGVSVGCPCGRCNESYTLIKSGSMYCPRCGYRESL